MLGPSVFLPAQSGGTMRSWQLARRLAKRHELTVLALSFSDQDWAMQKALERACGRAALVRMCEHEDIDLKRKLPWPLRYCQSRAVSRALQELSRESFDVAVVEFLHMAHYQSELSIPTMLCEHNIESSLYRQYARLAPTARHRAFYLATALQMERYEEKLWPRFPIRTVVSAHDQQEMMRRCSRGDSLVLPNGVELQGPCLEPNASRQILYAGNFRWFPNRDAALYLAQVIMPRVWERQPGLRLCLAGMTPPPSLLALAQDERIVVCANPPDMREVARDCFLCAVPLRSGSGTRLKILEAFGWGLPVVSSTIGCQGLEVTAGEALWVADDPDHFADCIVRLSEDRGLRESLARRARALVETKYTWDRCFEPLEAALQSLLAGEPA